MSSMNRVFLMGNLTRDPELRHTPSGIAVSDLGIAVSDNYRNKNGEPVERTCFADAVVWGRQAETCCEYLQKGAPILLEGRLQLDQWETDNGEKRSRLRVRADRVQFLPRANRDSAATAIATAAAAAPPASQPADDDRIPF